MNRIAGIFHLDGMPVAYTELDGMIEALKLHAREESRIWIREQVGLGGSSKGYHECFLAHSADELFSLAFDGRLDNRQELLASLQLEGLEGRRQVSDEEIVLGAYKKWELDCPRRLIGDFAFAIWDRQKQRLVCGRDHFGVKPLYYFASHRSFLFASRPEALLASGKVPLVIHQERIADFLVDPLEGIDKTSSFYKDVFRLPPAHILVVQTGRAILQRYWELCPTEGPESKTETEYLESFRELFKDSVRFRLRDARVPASMLSGGLDSSSIVGMGRRILVEEGRGPLHSFAFISNSPAKNRETSHVSSVLAQGDVQSHLISETELPQWLDKLVRAIEDETEPFDCLMNLNRAVYLHAAEQGVSALLDGIDGDVLLSGSGHLLQLWGQVAFRAIVEETWKAGGLTAEYKTGKSEFINSVLSTIAPYVPDWILKIGRKRRYQKILPSSIRESIIDRDFAVHSQLGERFAILHSHSPRPQAFKQMEFHRIALNHTFLTVGLERYERVASALGIEARHPFTDVHLAEFCLGLPWQLKTHRGWTKMILRKAMEPYLPSEVIWRRDKDSLMWEVNRLILKARAEYFYQITCDEQANLKPYVDLRKLMQFWQEYLTLGDEQHAELIWSGIALALWLRRQREMQINFRKRT